MKIVFLGNYEEYFKAIEYLNQKIDKYKMKIKFIKIWHPAYLLRNGCAESIFNQWKEQLTSERTIS